MTWHLSAALRASSFSIGTFGKWPFFQDHFFFVNTEEPFVRTLNVSPLELQSLCLWNRTLTFLSRTLFALIVKEAPGHGFASEAPSDTWCREQQAVKCTGWYSSAAFSPWIQTPSPLASWAWHRTYRCNHQCVLCLLIFALWEVCSVTKKCLYSDC